MRYLLLLVLLAACGHQGQEDNLVGTCDVAKQNIVMQYNQPVADSTDTTVTFVGLDQPVQSLGPKLAPGEVVTYTFEMVNGACQVTKLSDQ